MSAVLLELGYPYIDGYKPRSNYQKLLFEIVDKTLSFNISLQEAVQFVVNRPAITNMAHDVYPIWVDVPISIKKKSSKTRMPHFSPVRRNYLAQEALNRSLGLAGELFVVDLETKRLNAAGQKQLANRVEHASTAQGDGLGYDILSYETSGQERFIEVKTTAFGGTTPFYVTHNELLRS